MARPDRTVKLLNETQNIRALLAFVPIWSENLDNIRMMSIFHRFLRNIDQIFHNWYREKKSGLTGQAIKWKAPYFDKPGAY
jgi:hypothetical protein